MEVSGFRSATGDLRRRCVLVLMALFLVGSLLLLRLAFRTDFVDGAAFHGGSTSSLVSSEGRNVATTTAAAAAITTVYGPHRKLLIRHAPRARNQVTRVPGDRCSSSDIVINQGATTSLPDGIPTYTVEIRNQCVTGCSISRIHLSCGWFSSNTMVNPFVFKRLAYDDCLVNDGKPLACDATLSFQYASTFPYPLSVTSFFC